MKTLTIILALLLSATFAEAQLHFKGKVTTTDSTVCQITITHASDGFSRVIYPNRKGNWKLPYWLQKNYDYSIRFTDGTVEKFVIIWGAAPEDVWIDQKILLDVNLTDLANADRTLIFYFSPITCMWENGYLDKLHTFEHLMYKPYSRRYAPAKY